MWRTVPMSRTEVVPDNNSSAIPRRAENPKLRASCAAQKERVTTFIEVILNQELGEPFRRDAMKKPVRVAGIRREDMRPQQAAQ